MITCTVSISYKIVYGSQLSHFVILVLQIGHVSIRVVFFVIGNSQ